jgi:hypothetical protein
MFIFLKIKNTLTWVCLIFRRQSRVEWMMYSKITLYLHDFYSQSSELHDDVLRSISPGPGGITSQKGIVFYLQVDLLKLQQLSSQI